MFVLSLVETWTAYALLNCVVAYLEESTRWKRLRLSSVLSQLLIKGAVEDAHVLKALQIAHNYLAYVFLQLSFTFVSLKIFSVLEWGCNNAQCQKPLMKRMLRM